MTDKNVKQIEALPVGERISRMYRAFEGDYRVITIDKNKTERRYTVDFDKEFNTTIRQM